MNQLSSHSQKLGKAAAAHLLRRATFGSAPKDIRHFAGLTASEAIREIKKSPQPFSPPIDTVTGKSWLPARKNTNSPESHLRRFTIYSWLDHMLRQRHSLRSRMVFFLHSHFTTLQSRANYGSALYYQLKLFEHFALGNFKELAIKICSDQAMLMNLDGRYNRKESPNENFAREFLELYSIGKGPQSGTGDYSFYTEHDVKEAAKVFSGFYIDETFRKHIDQQTGLPMGRMLQYPDGEPTQHDFTVKTFSSKFGNRKITPKARTYQAVQQEIREFVEMVFSQEETARHICRKLYRFFVYHHISDETERQIITPLANILRNNNYSLEPVLDTLLSSRHFFDIGVSKSQQRISATLIKSPLDLLSQMVQHFGAYLPEKSRMEAFYTLYGELFSRMEDMGMQLYEPPDVAGYTAYHQAPDFNRNWISASTLAHRYKLADSLVSGIKRREYTGEIKIDVMAFVNDPGNVADPAEADQMVRELSSGLLARPLPEERISYFLHAVLLDGLSPKAWKMEWQQYKKTGDDRAIRRQLEHLCVKMMQSPEYQLF
jgi:uncharacterized protein (DUF1800 family)